LYVFKKVTSKLIEECTGWEREITETLSIIVYLQPLFLDLRLMGHNNMLCGDIRKVNKKSTGNGYDGNVTKGYMLLVYGTGIWYWYMLLVYGTGIWYWYMVLVYGTGIWNWYMVLVSPGPKTFYG